MSFATQGGSGNGPFVTPPEPDTNTDELVKVSADDTTAGYLDGKLVAGANITLTVLNPGANETLQISSDPGADELVKVSANDTTPGYLNGKLVAGTGITLTEQNDGGNESLLASVNAATMPLDTGYIWGLALNWISASQVQVEAGKCRNIADNFNLVLSANTTATLSATGVNGRDTGSEAANTWYHVWVIGDSTGVNPTATLLSTSSTVAGLTFPAGYDRARRVGAVRNNASSNIIEFNQQLRTGATRRINYDVQSYATMTVLSGYSVVAYTTVANSGFIPPTSNIGHFNYLGDSSSGIDSKVYFRPAGSGATSPVTQGELFGGDSGFVTVRTNTSQQIEVAVGSVLSSVDVAVYGYDDLLDD